MALLRRRNQKSGMPGQMRGMPGQGHRRQQRPLVAEPRQSQAQARRPVRPMMPKIPRGMDVQRYEAQRKSWAGIPIIGGLIELLRNIVYPSEAARFAKRRPLREGPAALGARGKGKRLIADQWREYGYEPTQRRKTA